VRSRTCTRRSSGIENTRRIAPLRLLPARAPITYSLPDQSGARTWRLAVRFPSRSRFPKPAQHLTAIYGQRNRLDAHFRALVRPSRPATDQSYPANLSVHRCQSQLPLPTRQSPRVVFFGAFITDIWRLTNTFQIAISQPGISGQTRGHLVHACRTTCALQSRRGFDFDRHTDLRRETAGEPPAERYQMLSTGFRSIRANIFASVCR